MTYLYCLYLLVSVVYHGFKFVALGGQLWHWYLTLIS